MMKKKIYLLLPYMPAEEAYSSSVGGIIDGDHVPLGIYYIASFLRENGCDVAVTDAIVQKLTEEDIIDEIESYDPAFVGISATTVHFPKAVSIARRIKKTFPRMVTIIGGRHVTSNMEHAMCCEAFDYGVVGEGEITTLALLDAVSRQAPVSGIEGVVYRDERGKPVYTGPRPFIENLDMLPFPAFDLIPDINAYKPPVFLHKELPLLSMITSRGCPGQCTFCAVSLGKKYRKRSSLNVFEEIKHLVNTYHVREVDFLDDNFLLDKQRIYDLFGMMRSAGLFIHWTCMARIGSVDYDFLKYLRDNGCWSIAFGIESGDEKILKTIKKGLSLKRTGQVAAWCRDLGIVTRGFFIIGHPLETVETIDRTIRFAIDTPLDIIAASFNTPFPGTQQYDEAEKYGTLDKTDLTRFSQFNPVFIPHGLTKEILLEKYKEIHVKFYLRPRIMVRFLKFCLRGGGVGRIERLKVLIMGVWFSFRTVLRGD